MTSRNGADVPAALSHLAEAGHTVAQLASDLSVARSTVYRWRAGRTFPNPSNFEALTEWTEQTFAVEARRKRLTPLAMHLQAAYRALETAEQRARNEELAQQIAARLAAAEQARLAEQQQRHATIRQLAADHRTRQDAATAAAVAAADRLVPQQRQPYRSITESADPFAVVASAREREVAMFSC